MYMECTRLALEPITYITPVEITKIPARAGWVLKIESPKKVRFFTPLYEATHLEGLGFPYKEFFEQMLSATEHDIRSMCEGLFTVGFEHEWNVIYEEVETTKNAYIIADCSIRVDTCFAIDWNNDRMVSVAKRIRGWEYRLQLSYYSGPDTEEPTEEEECLR